MAQREFWYQAFHQLGVVDEIIEGKPAAVCSYLPHFWSHWSGPDFQQPEADLDRLADVPALRAPSARQSAGTARTLKAHKQIGEGSRRFHVLLATKGGRE
ncbi:MAG TPA: hypothetical protein VIQ02_10870 [Jiangellaceae bacterium]